MAMATLTLTSSNWDAGRVRITYTASNGTLKITEIEGCRTDGYHSWNTSDTSITIKVGGTSKSVSLSHYIDFTASSSYTAWGATDTSWTGLSGTSISISVTMPSSTQAYSGAVFSGNATMSWTKYTIAYNANGGSGAPSSQTKTHGTNLTLSSTKPTRTGYTFKGWALTKADADDGTWYYQAGSTCGRNEDLTLYAVWEEHILTVNYYSNYATSFSGTFTPENTVNGNNVLVYTSKYYYDNDYSTYGLANYSSSGSLQMARTGYTATKYWGTSTSGGTLVHEDTAFTTGQALAKALGKDLSSGNASINVYAQWEANSYTYNIVYKSSSGAQLGTATISKNYGTTNTVSPESFAGYTSPSSQSVKWDSTTAKTITFTYTPITYNVTINCNGGSGVNSRTYTVETATFTLGTPTRTGHTFDGWTGSNGNTAQKTVSISKGSTGDKSYTAQWRANVLTIKYHPNGGKINSDKYNINNNLIGLISSSSVLEDKWNYNTGHTDGLYNAKTFGLTREGYKFVGWKLGSSGMTVFDQDDASVVPTDLASDLTTGDRTVTLYAVWEISGVVYIDNGTTLEPYLVYIDNGSSWDLYLAYVDDGTDWITIS